MIDFDNELKSIFQIGIRMGQENPKQDAEKMAETLLMLTKMGAKGRNILELLVEKYKDGNN
jgi:hypothetical protein